MAYYLFRWTYKDLAIKALHQTPQDRPAQLRKAVEAASMGMRTMRERSQRLGAEFEIRTAKGQGSVVRVVKM